MVSIEGPKGLGHLSAHGNGVLSIVGHPRYPNSPGSPAAVAELLAVFRKLPGPTFWPDDVSLLDREHVDPGRLLDSLMSATAISWRLLACTTADWPRLTNGWLAML